MSIKVRDENKEFKEVYVKDDLDGLFVKSCIINGNPKATSSSNITAILPDGLTVDNIAIVNVLVAENVETTGTANKVNYYRPEISLVDTTLILNNVDGFPIEKTPKIIISYLKKRITPVG